MYLCRFASDRSLIVLCPVLFVDRRREVVDKQRPMLANEGCKWLEREIGWPCGSRVTLIGGGVRLSVDCHLFASLSLNLTTTKGDERKDEF